MPAHAPTHPRHPAHAAFCTGSLLTHALCVLHLPVCGGGGGGRYLPLPLLTSHPFLAPNRGGPAFSGCCPGTPPRPGPGSDSAGGSWKACVHSRIHSPITEKAGRETSLRPQLVSRVKRISDPKAVMEINRDEAFWAAGLLRRAGRRPSLARVFKDGRAPARELGEVSMQLTAGKFPDTLLTPFPQALGQVPGHGIKRHQRCPALNELRAGGEDRSEPHHSPPSPRSQATLRQFLSPLGPVTQSPSFLPPAGK